MTIDHRGDAQAQSGDVLSPGPLLGIVRGAPRDVVYRAGAKCASLPIGHMEQIDQGSWSVCSCLKASAGPFLTYYAEAHCAGQQVQARRRVFLPHGHPVKAPDGIVDGDTPTFPRGTRVRTGASHQFKLHPVGIQKRQHLFIES